MVEPDENLSVWSWPERERPSVDAQRAFVDLLNTLCGAIHLNEHQDVLPQVIDSLMTIAECSAVAQETDPEDLRNIPFSRSSEIDLVETLLGVAAYTCPLEDNLAELRSAFLDATGRSRSKDDRAPMTT
ncbi:MAG: hypothetical protein U0798_09370 [Gemmataceae bacterium]